MKTKASHRILKVCTVALSLCGLILFQNCATSSQDTPPETCTTLDCTTLKYSLFVADMDGSNVSVIKTSSYQDMTHPRVSNDKNWVAYTTYNTTNGDGCASLDIGYLNTEIRAIQINGTGDKRIIAPLANEFNTNSYWIGTSNEFTYLSGPVASLKFYRATVDASMNLVSGPTLIPVAGTIPVPMDPATHSGTDKIVFPGLYNPGSGFVKSIFIMNLSDSSNLVGLSLGRDHAGNVLTCTNAACTNIMENDPKVSPDGSKVAFMRQAPEAGANGHGFHIFVVPVASPLNEVDISYSAIGADVLLNDALPEWIDNNTMVFSTIEIVSATNYSKNVYTMKSDGTQRTKISLPAGYRYSDVFPFTDGTGKQRLVISAEKINATCYQ
jgi:Tol biopolymer transport system component